MMLEKALSSKTKIRVLKVFHRFPGRVLTLSDIADITDKSNGALQPALSELVDAGLLKATKVGKAVTYRLNSDNPFSKKVMEIFAVESEILRTVAKEFATLMPKRGVISIILFGSVARGESTEKSDIDLLIVYRGKRSYVEKNTNVLAGKYLEQDILVSPVMYSEDDVRDMAKQYNSFVSRIEDEGIVLYGRGLKDIYGKRVR